MVKKLLSITGILCFLLLIGWGGYYYWQGTPRYSLYQMGKAIKEHDSKTLLRYLDIDQIVDGLADSTSAAVAEKTSPAAPSEEPKRNPNSSAGTRGFLERIMPQVIKALKPILNRQLIKIVEDIGSGKTISPLALCTLSQVKRTGQLAEVSIQADNDRTYTFTMARISRKEWKIIRINMDLLDFLQKPPRAGR